MKLFRLLLLCMFFSGFGQSDPEKEGIAKSSLQLLDQEISKWVEEGHLIGAEVLIIKNEKTIFHEAFGWSDREEKTPVAKNSIWSIMSMSKPITATAILHLMEEDKLSLNDKVTAYLPSFKGHPNTTIKHLLSHTSGYEDIDYLPVYETDFKAWTERWAQVKPTLELGQYAYANLNYFLLGYIIEQVSGVSTDKYIANKIFKPLNIKELYPFFTPDEPWASRVNSRYRWEEGRYRKFWTHKYEVRWAFYPGAWGFWGTAMDYATFMQLWLDKGKHDKVHLLQENTIDLALSQHGDNYGLGWALQRNTNGQLQYFWHGGHDGTRAYAFPEENTIVIYMNHSRNGEHLGAFEALLNDLDIVAAKPNMIPFPESKSFLTLTQNQVEALEGIYIADDFENAPPFKMEVRQNKGDLTIQYASLGSAFSTKDHLLPINNLQFLLGAISQDHPTLYDPNVSLSFTDNSKQASKVHWMIHADTLFTGYRTTANELAQIEAQTVRTHQYLDAIIEEAIEQKGVAYARRLNASIAENEGDSIMIKEIYLNALGYQYLLKNEPEKAMAVLEMNLIHYPNSPDIWDMLGQVALRSGKTENAEAYFREAIRKAEVQNDHRLNYYKLNLERVRSKSR
ncbi:serine hydrolase [Robertkochia marina]|uniref:Serine hydrolase n=1 Tax=Robertkochia marina TaxID=1227945 RepID=A0A4S3M3J6_9FLAO|nr:serine hydrolase domain-containing protein [Robertkochia marina]THD69269.1 serine hydrolase [Robertkochia marina]TRZ47472.1 hypothetical protein D3A96_01835 [Robertkochia marina]